MQGLRGMAVLLAVWLGLWLSVAGAAEAPVRVAADPDYAPIDGFDSRGRHRGLSADLLALLATRSGLRFEVQRYASLAEAEAALDSGRAELRASVLKPPAPTSGRIYSRPYLRVPAALIGRPEAGAATTLAELQGRRIAVVEGRLWAALLRAQGHAEDLRPAADVATALASVVEGRADAFVGDLISAEPVLRQLGLGGTLVVLGSSGLEAELAFAAKPADAPLIAALDAALATVTVEEEAALQARWLQAGATETPSVEPVPAALAGTISALRGTLPEGLAEREALLAALNTAQAADTEADAVLARIDALAASIATAEATLAAPEPPPAAAELLRWRSSLSQRASLENLEQLLAVEQAARTALREAIQRGGSELDALRERPATLRRALAELEAPPPAAAATATADRPAQRVAAIAAAAERRLWLARQALLLKEQAGAETLLRAAERRQRELQQELVQREERIAVLEQRIAEQGDNELRSLVTTLRAEQARHAQAAVPVRDAAAGNLAIGERLLAQSRRLTELREQLLRLERQSAEVARALANAQARVEIGGITATVGRLLMAERRKLPPATAIRAQQRALQAELVEVRLAQLAVGDEREALGSIGTAVRARLGGDHDLDPGTDPAQRAALTDLLLQRAELLPRLELQQQRVAEVLEAAERQLRQLATDGQALSGLIEQHLLWVPSHPPVSTPWLAPLTAEVLDLLKPSRWAGSGRRLLAALNGAPVWWALLTLPLVLWSLWPAIDRALARRVAAWHGDAYTPTLTALALTLLRAAPMALLLALLGQLLQGAGEGGRFTHSLGRALSQLAPHVYLATLLIASCRPGGLADAHLRWPVARREALLRLRPWLYFGLLPLLLLVGLGEARDLEYPGGSLLQLALVLASLALAAIGGWLLAPGRLLAGSDGQPDPLPRLRRSLRVGLVGGGLLLAVLPLAGYILTVGILLDTLLGTLWVLYAVLLGHGLVWRWLVLSERRLAAAQRAAAPATTDAAGRLADNDESPDLQLVGAQSHGLLRASTAMLLAAGLLWSLAGVAPAFALLDTVTLWQTVSEIDGARVTDVVTLGDLLLALVVLVFGVIAARNLPGLLELLLLQRFTGDASLRYAVVTVSRYLITFLLLVLVFGLLGVRWGHLQWLAAAFSVGLGFGLQEIFGNFVAGLILLFERPFRVGDVVTLGEYTGTVRKIRTRATTIVDFDNKDVVIPNKAFITDRFVNWTLSDSSTRITLKIGVDYHADPRVVRDLLLQLAAADPRVLRDPAPAAWFMEFGGSALHFELRCFVATIRDRLPVTDALHTTILDALRARGIGIPYPQLEVHLKQAAKAAPGG
jgi:potassium efflux system protein